MMEMVRKKGLDLFKYSTFWKGVKFGRSVNDKQMHGNRVQKSRRRQECQELTSKMCWPNIESGPSALTLMLHIRPSPMYVSVSVKLQSHCWVCDETKQAILIVNLTDVLVGTHKSICEHVTWKRRWVIGDTILLHGCFTFFTPYVRKDVATRSLPRNFLPCRMQQYMNKTWHGDIWTSVRTRQMQPNSPTEACFRARCSASEMAVLLTATHITGMCVRETWMSVHYDLNRYSTSTYFLLNPGLPVFFSAAPHSFLSSIALCSCWKIAQCFWIDDTFVVEITSILHRIYMERRDIGIRHNGWFWQKCRSPEIVPFT